MTTATPHSPPHILASPPRERRRQNEGDGEFGACLGIIASFLLLSPSSRSRHDDFFHRSRARLSSRQRQGSPRVESHINRCTSMTHATEPRQPSFIVSKSPRLILRHSLPHPFTSHHSHDGAAASTFYFSNPPRRRRGNHIYLTVHASRLLLPPRFCDDHPSKHRILLVILLQLPQPPHQPPPCPLPHPREPTCHRRSLPSSISCQQHRFTRLFLLPFLPTLLPDLHHQRRVLCAPLLYRRPPPRLQGWHLVDFIHASRSQFSLPYERDPHCSR